MDRSVRGHRKEGARAVEAQRREARREVYDSVRAQIQTGDLLLYRGRTLFSRLIRWGSYSVYSHVAIAAWWGNRLVVFECRGRGGVTIKPLRRAIEHYDCRIDWWSLRPDLAEKLDRGRLISEAIAELGKRYSLKGVLSFGWRILRGQLRGSGDPVGAPEAYFCSQYVSRCFREAGVDLVSEARDAYTSPGAIARSGAVRLLAVLRRNPH